MKIGFIGAGKMATAIARGVLNSNLCTPGEMIGSARSEATRDLFIKEIPGVALTYDNNVVIQNSEITFLCVKPIHACEVLRGLRCLRPGTLIVSVVAGVSLARLQEAAGSETAMIRSMPNTPCLVGKGVIAYARGANVSDEQAATVEKIFSAVGSVHAVPETLIDVVNGLSGSGPAYVYLVIEALADGGVLMGLPRVLAASMAARTVLGAAEMVCRTGLHPAELREAVASPGGTTMAALEVLEQAGVRSAMIGAVRAATERAREMGTVKPEAPKAE
jgi:pyrroline-5-carboxylate reductase